LFTRLFEDGEFEAGTASILETIAAGPTVALSLSKQLLDAESASLDDTLEREARYQALALETDDHAEGARAFVERREPEFTGE
jgi:enoyl-CoA hydratase/carnithine racemase